MLAYSFELGCKTTPVKITRRSPGPRPPAPDGYLALGFCTAVHAPRMEIHALGSCTAVLDPRRKKLHHALGTPRRKAKQKSALFRTWCRSVRCVQADAEPRARVRSVSSRSRSTFDGCSFHIFLSYPSISSYATKIPQPMMFLNGSAGELTVLAMSCGALKSSIELGRNGTFQVIDDVTCTESITIVAGQAITLEPEHVASVDTTVMIAQPFAGTSGRRSSSGTSSNSADGDGPDGQSLFIVQAGGSLNVLRMKFSSSISGGDNGNGDVSASTSAATTTNITSGDDGGNGVRAIYNAGDLTLQHCNFLDVSGASAGSNEYGQVKNGGAVRNVYTHMYVYMKRRSFIEKNVMHDYLWFSLVHLIRVESWPEHAV